MEFLAPVLHRVKGEQTMEEVVLEEPKQGEVRVRMAAAGICHSCLSHADGSFGDVPLPTILGDEGAGVVDAVGPGGSVLRPGDHVIVSWAPSCGRCRFCTSGRPSLCERILVPGCMSDGTPRFRMNGDPVFHMGPSTYSPYIVVDESAAVSIRRDMPLDKAALIGCAVTTGLGAVTNTAGVRPGNSVVVFGCGGVGQSAVQGAALVGANPVIAVDVVDHKLEMARRLGATETIRADQADVVDTVRDLTGGGADYTIVAVGSTTVMEQAIAALGKSGTCVFVGGPRVGESVAVDPFHLLTGERRVVGSRYGSSNPHVAFPQLVDLYLAGKLKLDELISRRYPVDQVNEASTALAEGLDLRGLLVFDRI